MNGTQQQNDSHLNTSKSPKQDLNTMTPSSNTSSNVQQQQQQQHSALQNPQHMHPQLYTQLINAANQSTLQNMINPNQNLIASINAANFANFVNLSNPIDSQHHQAMQAHLLNNILNAQSTQIANSTRSSSANSNNLNDEHQLYEYMQQLLEEKDKLKELFNEPINLLLPMCSKLLDEGIYIFI